MKRKLGVAVVFFSLFTMVAFTQIQADSAPAVGMAPAGEIIIDVMKVREGVGVPFDHSLHSAFECEACHHMWDGESEIMSCAEGGCHENLEVSGIDEYDSYFKIMHGKNIGEDYISCVKCHADMFGERKYEGCTGSVCHPGGYHVK